MKLALTFIFTLTILSVPALTYAQIVPCDGPNCTTCDFVALGQNLLTWFISVMAGVIALVFAIGGIKMVMAGGNEGKITEARGMMTNAIIGFVILLSAWLVVDTIMKTFVKGDYLIGPWNEIECVAQPELVDTGLPAEDSIAKCTDDGALISEYGGSPIGLEAAGLETMVACYLNNLEISAIIDMSKVYTVDRSSPRCSLTNGNPTCGPCSHSINSCHYGRGSGQGSMAVDFNAKDATSERELYNLLKTYNNLCGGKIIFENSHTHISLPGC